jgi:GntR family transcriptional regulator
MVCQDACMAPRPRIPAYQRVADELRARVLAGEFEHHVSLPGADALADQYEVSRRTAHRAVRILVDEGLLVVIPSYGTFLA